MQSIKCYFFIGIIAVFCYISYEAYLLFSPPSIPKIDQNIWWGSKQPLEEDNLVLPFQINVSEKVITDLKWRLENHRPLTPSIEKSENKYGSNSVFLKEIIEFWKHNYNWSEREIYLNRHPQFITKIQGLDVHFIHVKPNQTKNKIVYPILLLHGWPGSVREFYDVIDILTTRNELTENKNFLLEVIVPSLPGYGFSESTSKPGLDFAQVAILMKKLMNRLGHEKFYVQGGDVGSIILQILCVLFPETVLGFHTNFPLVYTAKSYLKPILGLLLFHPSLFVKPEHYDRVYPLTEKGIFIFQESGYLHLQMTKPDSVGASINDSPVGMAAYFLEKFITGSNFTWISHFNSQDLEKKFSFTKLIDNLMYYWVTGTATTSFRLYYESLGKVIWSDTFTLMRVPVQTPTAIFRSKFDLYMPDGVLNEIYKNLLQLSDYDTGHFPAFENPTLFSQDLLSAMEKFLKH